MTVLQSGREVYIDETERKPNRYAANVLGGIVAVIAIVCVMNWVGVFEVNNLLVDACLVVSLSQFIVMCVIASRPGLIIKPAVKYVIISMVLFLVLTLTVLLNIHAILGYVLPILLATQYRSRTFSRVALVGSIACCGIAPVLSYLLDTWSLVFLTGYMETFCRVTVGVTPGNSTSVARAIWMITLYWSLPQMLTLGAFGIFLFSATDNGIRGINDQLQVLDLRDDLTKQLETKVSMQEKVLYAMSDIIENRDLETGGHVRRTSAVVGLLMDAMRRDNLSAVTDAFYSNVIRTAPMHDIGKIAISDAILRKPGRLTAEEYAIVKQHPVKSCEIITQALTGIEDEELIRVAGNIAKYHHERMDGNGYPEGLRGAEIPLEARIMAIADVYDALVSERCYKAPMAFDEAYATIESSIGSQFDPELFRYFSQCRRDIERFYQS